VYVPAHAVADPNTAHTDADPDVYVPHAAADPDPDVYVPHADAASVEPTAASVEPTAASAEPGPVADDGDSIHPATHTPGVGQRQR
jgi:hypothetical protein